MRDAASRGMISKKRLEKNLGKVLKGALAAMPAIPYITKRRSSIVMPLVLGGIGVALMGGMAAVMFLSPRTRYRAMDMAKNTYGKLESQITQLKNMSSEHSSVANGLSKDGMIGSSYSTTGL